jgi:hypothetical protein
MPIQINSLVVGVVLHASMLGMGSQVLHADAPAASPPKFERRGELEKIQVTSPGGPATLLRTLIVGAPKLTHRDPLPLEEVTDERGVRSLVGPRGPLYVLFDQEIWGISKQGHCLRVTRSQPVPLVVRGLDEVVERYVERCQQQSALSFPNGPGGYRNLDLIHLFGIRDFVASGRAWTWDGDLQSVTATGKGVEVRLTMSSNVVLALTLNEHLEAVDAHRNGESLPLLLQPLNDGNPNSSAHGFQSRGSTVVPSNHGPVELAFVQRVSSNGEVSDNDVTAVVIPENHALAVVPLESRMAVLDGKLVALSLMKNGRLALFGRPRATLPFDASAPKAFEREMIAFEAEWKRDGGQLTPEAILDLPALLAGDSRFPPGTIFDLGAGPIQIRKGVLSKTVNSSAGPSVTVFLSPDRKLSLTPPGS